jgi:peptidyl-prolyl cis-trans isomerase C/foldase protein PrsA
MPIKLFALAILLLGITLPGCRSSQRSRAGGAQVVEDNSPVIAEINGAPERRAAFERFVKSRLSDFYQPSAQNQSDSDQLRSRLLDEFIQRQVIVREAQRRGIQTTDEEILRAIEDQHQQASAATSGQQPTALASSERMEEMKNDLLTIKYYKSEVLNNVSVTPEEIENFYKQNASQYQQQNGFYVREIRVATTEEAQQLHRQLLRKPADFATLAREHSTAPSAAQGGLMYYSTQQLPPVLEQAITPLKVGAISGVVKSNYGYHIFKLERRAEPLPLDKVRKPIEDRLLSDKNQALIDAFNKRALAGAQIKIHYDRLGFNYTGDFKPPRNNS